ncbi:MAG: PAS domain-containing sensor histidine kinase [Actinomycetota bacterium]
MSGEDPHPQRSGAETIGDDDALLSLLVSRMPAILWTTDTDLRITSVHGAGLGALGLEGKDIPGTTLREWFPVEDQDFELFRAAREALRGRPQNADVEFMGRFFQTHVEPLRDERDDILGVIGVSIDVTERRGSEEGLRRERELTSRLIESSVDGILAFDRECRYTVWNPAMERISGVSRADVLGRRAFEVFPFLKETGEDRFFYEALGGRNVKAEDRPYRIPETGRRGTFEAQYSPLHGSRGEVVGGVAIVRDITERKRLEAFRDEFISLAAHELRDPVLVISGFASHLLGGREHLDRDQVQALEAVARHAERLAILVRDLLDLSRLQRGSLEVHCKPVPLSSIVDEVLSLNEPPPPKSARADVGEGVVVMADPERLKQAMANLVTNAYRYGGTSIEISGRRAGATVEVIVSDDGEGIPEAFVPQLFDSFARGPNSRHLSGSGLGLSIARAALEAMGGGIRYDPGGARGARFTMSIPPCASST